MPDSSRAAQEAAVRDLRELHDDAEGADRPRAALLLGLAIADLAAQLPDTDPRVPELAREGLARLDEPDVTTTDVARARESLRRRLRSSRKPRETSTVPPAAGEPDGIPVETLRLGGGDMSWNVDWATLRSATEEGREVMDALRFMQPSLPGPLQQFMAGGFDVFGAVDAGQWTPESDRALAGLTQLAETTGVGTETLPFLQGLSLFIRLRRAMSAGAGKDHPDWPSTAEIDRVVAALESQPDLVHGLGAPFSDFTGMSRFLAASLLVAPVWADIRSGAGTRDWAWFDGTVRRLERAREHMKEVPPALAGGLQPACDRIDTTIAALKRAMGEAGGPGSPAGAGEPAGPAADTSPPTAVPSFPADAAADQEESSFLADAATGQEEPLSLSDAPLGQFSWEKLKGLRVLGNSLPASPVFSALQAMTHWGEVTFFQRWTPEQDQVLEALQQTADQLAAEREPEQADLIIVRAVLALGALCDGTKGPTARRRTRTRPPPSLPPRLRTSRRCLTSCRERPVFLRVCRSKTSPGYCTFRPG